MKLPGLPFSKPAGARNAAGALLSGEEDELSTLRKKIQELQLQLELHHLVIERYRKFIEDGESKTIAELRSLVRPADSAVVEMKMLISDQFHPYVYGQNFLHAVQKALDTVFSYKKVSMPVSFWTSFGDITRLHAGEDIDKALLLCSLLRALGSDGARVLIGKEKNAWVAFDFGEKHYVIDIANRTMSAYPLDDDAIHAFMHAVQYSFNDKEYQDFSEA
ncbi:MAG: hypothetical protein V1728_04305 [Candidatus Micrarchaeota archaeon]